MKKVLALLLALSFLAPAALVACNPNASERENTAPSLQESAPADSAEEPSSPDSAEPTPPESAPESPAPDSSEEQKPDPTPPPTPKAQYVQCTGNNVNLRAGAGIDFAVLGVAEKGTTYAVTGKIGSWYKTYYRGKIAYLSASYAALFSLEKTENKAEAAIEEGYKLLGVPYVYGAVRLHDGTGKLLSGFTMQKFDCSSLIQYIFYKGTGTLLGVHTRSQVKQGNFVKRKDLQRGDCIYFTNESRQYNVGIERIGHVALYLGDGYILHTSSDYARIEKMSSKRWSFYVEARRFV